MKMTLRRRLFMYLVFLLLLFILVQTLLYSFVEYRGWVMHPEEPLVEEMEEVAIAVGLNLLLLPFLLSLVWWLSKRMLMPVRAMAETAARISGGALTERIDTRPMPADEMRNLAETLNGAFIRYEALVQRLQRFTGDASHQLRTPITAMQTMGEVALSRSREPEVYREAVENMLEQLDRLSGIVESLLELSRLESGALRARFPPLDCGAVVEKAVRIHEPLSEDLGVAFDCKTRSGLMVMGIEELLLELIGNLLDNAIRHSPRGGRIDVSVAQRNDMAVLLVQDSGPGVPAEHAALIFERFYQIPAGRPGGAGLGLALASDIAEVHGGRLTLANPGRPGACFECVLPLRAAAKRGDR